MFEKKERIQSTFESKNSTTRSYTKIKTAYECAKNEILNQEMEMAIQKQNSKNKAAIANSSFFKK